MRIHFHSSSSPQTTVTTSIVTSFHHIHHFQPSHPPHPPTMDPSLPKGQRCSVLYDGQADITSAATLPPAGQQLSDWNVCEVMARAAKFLPPADFQTRWPDDFDARGWPWKLRPNRGKPALIPGRDGEERYVLVGRIYSLHGDEGHAAGLVRLNQDAGKEGKEMYHKYRDRFSPGHRRVVSDRSARSERFTDLFMQTTSAAAAAPAPAPAPAPAMPGWSSSWATSSPYLQAPPPSSSQQQPPAAYDYRAAAATITSRPSGAPRAGRPTSSQVVGPRGPVRAGDRSRTFHLTGEGSSGLERGPANPTSAPSRPHPVPQQQQTSTGPSDPNNLFDMDQFLRDFDPSADFDLSADLDLSEFLPAPDPAPVPAPARQDDLDRARLDVMARRDADLEALAGRHPENTSLRRELARVIARNRTEREALQARLRRRR